MIAPPILFLQHAQHPCTAQDFSTTLDCFPPGCENHGNPAHLLMYCLGTECDRQGEAKCQVG